MEGSKVEPFTAKETARIVGLEYATLDSWSRRGGFFTASVRESSGRGKAIRLYSLVDCFELASIKKLRDMGVSLQSLRKAKGIMAGLDLTTPWTFIIVSPSGDLHVEVGEDQVISVLRQPGQYALRAVNLTEVARQVEQKASEVVKERTVSVA